MTEPGDLDERAAAAPADASLTLSTVAAVLTVQGVTELLGLPWNAKPAAVCRAVQNLKNAIVETTGCKPEEVQECVIEQGRPVCNVHMGAVLRKQFELENRALDAETRAANAEATLRVLVDELAYHANPGNLNPSVWDYMRVKAMARDLLRRASHGIETDWQAIVERYGTSTSKPGA